MRKLFPFSFRGKNIKSVIFSSVIYSLIFAAVTTVAFLLRLVDMPDFLSTAVNIIRQLSLLYCAGGIVVSVLNAADLLNRK